MIRAVSDMAVNEETITSAACEEVSGIACEEPRWLQGILIFRY